MEFGPTQLSGGPIPLSIVGAAFTTALLLLALWAWLLPQKSFLSSLASATAMLAAGVLFILVTLAIIRLQVAWPRDFNSRVLDTLVVLAWYFVGYTLFRYGQRRGRVA
jgi:hypothetical protein